MSLKSIFIVKFKDRVFTKICVADQKYCVDYVDDQKYCLKIDCVDDQKYCLFFYLLFFFRIMSSFNMKKCDLD